MFVGGHGPSSRAGIDSRPHGFVGLPPCSGRSLERAESTRASSAYAGGGVFPREIITTRPELLDAQPGRTKSLAPRQMARAAGRTGGRTNHLRQGYGGPPKLYAKAEVLRSRRVCAMTLEITDARSWHMAGAVPAHPAGIQPGESVHWRAVSGRYINCSGGMSSCRTTSTSVTTKRKSARDVSVSGSYDSAAWRATATSTGSSAMGATICSRGRGLRSTLNVSSPPSPQLRARGKISELGGGCPAKELILQSILEFAAAPHKTRITWSASCSFPPRGRHARSDSAAKPRIRPIRHLHAGADRAPRDRATRRIFHHWPVRLHTSSTQRSRPPRPHRQHRGSRRAAIALNRTPRRASSRIADLRPHA